MVDEWWLLTDNDVWKMSLKGSGRSWWLMKACDGYWHTIMFNECPWGSVVGPDGWIKPVMATDEISMSMALMALGRPSDFRWLFIFPLFLDRHTPYFSVDITFWLTLLFVWHYVLVDIALYCITLKFHCFRLPGSWLIVWVWVVVVGVLIQLPCNPNQVLDWIEFRWKLGWVVTTKLKTKPNTIGLWPRWN